MQYSFLSPLLKRSRTCPYGKAKQCHPGGSCRPAPPRVAARLLGITRSQLYSRIQKYGIA